MHFRIVIPESSESHDLCYMSKGVWEGVYFQFARKLTAKNRENRIMFFGVALRTRMGMHILYTVSVMDCWIGKGNDDAHSVVARDGLLEPAELSMHLSFTLNRTIDKHAPIRLIDN